MMIRKHFKHLTPKYMHYEQRFSNRLQEEYKFYESIFLCDLNGEVIVASPRMITGRRFHKEDPFFKKAAGGEVFVSNIMPSDLTEKPVFIIFA